MPHDTLENTIGTRKRPLSFAKFYEQQKAKMPTRKPARAKVEHTGTMFAKRNKRLTIREGALRSMSIIINYTKVTTGEKKQYEINPISYRYRKLKKGWRRVLFGEDKNEGKQIKMFVIENIGNVVLTDRKFRSSFKVEIE